MTGGLPWGLLGTLWGRTVLFPHQPEPAHQPRPQLCAQPRLGPQGPEVGSHKVYARGSLEAFFGEGRMSSG